MTACTWLDTHRAQVRLPQHTPLLVLPRHGYRLRTPRTANPPRPGSARPIRDAQAELDNPRTSTSFQLPSTARHMSSGAHLTMQPTAAHGYERHVSPGPSCNPCQKTLDLGTATVTVASHVLNTEHWCTTACISMYQLLTQHWQSHEKSSTVRCPHTPYNIKKCTLPKYEQSPTRHGKSQAGRTAPIMMFCPSAPRQVA